MRIPLRFSPTVLHFAAIFLATAFAVTPAAAQKCAGRDVMPEFKAKDPEIYAAIEAAARATPNTDALLWRIEREGAKDIPPSYLFGTIHLSDERVTALPWRAKGALADSKSVMLEVADLSPAATQAVMSEATDLFMFNDGRRLDTLLSADEFKTVKTTLQAAGLPADVGAMFKPWIVYMLLSVSDCERRKVQAGATVLDMQIAGIAKKRGVPVTGLETVKEQLVSLASVPDAQQVEMLKATLHWAKRTDDLMETVLQLYLKRQMGSAWPFQVALARKAGIDPAPLAAFYEKVLLERNVRMRDRALPALEKGGTFIAVGALHLSGNDGLVALFRNAGYTVTPAE